MPSVVSESERGNMIGVVIGLLLLLAAIGYIMRSQRKHGWEWFSPLALMYGVFIPPPPPDDQDNE